MATPAENDYTALAQQFGGTTLEHAPDATGAAQDKNKILPDNAALDYVALAKQHGGATVKHASAQKPAKKHEPGNKENPGKEKPDKEKPEWMHPVSKPDFISNPSGEGLYRMSQSSTGVWGDAPEINVPFSKVNSAVEAGYRLHADDAPRFQKDVTHKGWGPNLGDRAKKLLAELTEPMADTPLPAHDAENPISSEWYRLNAALGNVEKMPFNALSRTTRGVAGLPGQVIETAKGIAEGSPEALESLDPATVAETEFKGLKRDTGTLGPVAAWANVLGDAGTMAVAGKAAGDAGAAGTQLGYDAMRSEFGQHLVNDLRDLARNEEGYFELPEGRTGGGQAAAGGGQAAGTPHLLERAVERGARMNALRGLLGDQTPERLATLLDNFEEKGRRAEAAGDTQGATQAAFVDSYLSHLLEDAVARRPEAGLLEAAVDQAEEFPGRKGARATKGKQARSSVGEKPVAGARGEAGDAAAPNTAAIMKELREAARQRRLAAAAEPTAPEVQGAEEGAWLETMVPNVLALLSPPAPPAPPATPAAGPDAAAPPQGQAGSTEAGTAQVPEDIGSFIGRRMEADKYGHGLGLAQASGLPVVRNYDDLPPVPEGMVRVYHGAHAEDLAAIKSNGVKSGKELNKGEATPFVLATTYPQVPSGEASFYGRPSIVVADVPRSQFVNEGSREVSLPSIPPENIVGAYIPKINPDWDSVKLDDLQRYTAEYNALKAPAEQPAAATPPEEQVSKVAGSSEVAAPEAAAPSEAAAEVVSPKPERADSEQSAPPQVVKDVYRAALREARAAYSALKPETVAAYEKALRDYELSRPAGMRQYLREQMGQADTAGALADVDELERMYELTPAVGPARADSEPPAAPAVRLSLHDALDEAYGDYNAAKALLTQHGAKYVFTYPGGEIYTHGGAVVDLDKDGYATYHRDADEFVRQADLDTFAPDWESRFNAEFWKNPGTLYHATPDENRAAILKNGLNTANRTRGLSNRGVRSAVFTVTDPESLADGSYGDTVIAIDMEALGKTNKPYVEQEPDIAEGAVRELLAHRLGLENFHYDYEQGIDPNTVIIHGGISARFLSVEGEPATDATGTPEFKKWFGESKVVDAGGKPQVVYHGTRRDFQAFDPDAKRETPNTDRVFFFTDHPAIAETYSGKRDTGSNIMPVYLSFQSPLVIDGLDHRTNTPLPLHQFVREDAIKAAQAKGHDGIIVKNTADRGGAGDPDTGPTNVYIAFKPEQIKSAIGNRGTFDAENPNILADQEKLGQERPAAPVWHLKSERVIGEKMKGPMAGADVLKMLQNNGVSPDELKWTGLDEYLPGAGKVTPDAVRNFISQNAIQVEEVTKGPGSVFRSPFPTREALQAAIDGDEMLVNPDGTLRKGLTIEQNHSGWNVWDSSSKESPAKYASYQQPGGENYRELLLTMPAKSVPQYFIAYKNGSTIGTGYATRELAESNLDEIFPNRRFDQGDLEVRQGTGDRSTTTSGSQNFTTTHWEEPNVLVHVRMNDRVGADGKKLLHIEEIQSDWGQKIRRERQKLKEKVNDNFRDVVTAMKQAGLVEEICD